MNNFYFTADTHFNHTNVIRYCNRPFASVEEMNRQMVNNWNDRIDSTDTVYHLGDFGFGDISDVLGKLNGRIILIQGSHDKSAWLCKDKFLKIIPLLEIEVRKQVIVLCHYSMRVWAKSHYNSWHLYGHSHGNLSPWGKSFDVGVDSHGFKPWSFDEIAERMAMLPNNFNLVKKY